MAYVERMIAPGEEMIGVSRIHWIHVVQGLLWLIGLMALGFVLDSLIAGFFGLILPSVQFAGALLEATWLELFFLCAGLYIFSVYFIHFATTEVALTNQRVIYKRGWIFVDIKEVNLDEIKGSNIDLGLLGRFLGYGSIALDARFVRDTQLPFINEPYRFVRAMNEAQVNIEDHFALVLDDGHQKKARFEHRKRHVPPEENSRSGPQKVVESVDEAVEASATSPAHAEDSPVELKITSKGASLERAPQVRGCRRGHRGTGCRPVHGGLYRRVDQNCRP